jgi:cobyrinic acid a,c-diamide synthase
MNGFIISGTNSGCGKTTISIGLMALFQELGYDVAPFKTGPDYIDPLFHSRVLNKSSYNLDGYMLSADKVRYLFAKHLQENQLAIIEGVMGMYDGLGKDSLGSAHHLSQILAIPNILVVSCKSLYQSVAAIVKGFATLKDDSNVKGVILNHVPSDSYYQFLKETIESQTGIACVGYVPSNKEFALESRHLGLVQAEEVDSIDDKIALLKQTLKQTIDTDKLLEVTRIKQQSETFIKPPKLDLSDLHIGVAYDKAFRFYYQDNLELLEELGATLHYFSPLNEKSIPSNCNCLYIGGGYPEVFAKELSGNEPILKSIKEAAAKEMPIYAECGGLMYLTQAINQLDETSNHMVGIFNARTQMTKRLNRFGYAELTYNNTTSRCHEFHRSEILDPPTPNYQLNYQLEKKEKGKQWQCGLKKDNTLAGYAHVHFYSNFSFFEQIIALWRKATI